MLAKNMTLHRMILFLAVSLLAGIQVFVDVSVSLAVPFQPTVEPAIRRLRSQRAKVYPFDVSAVELFRSRGSGSLGFPIRIRITSAVPLQQDQAFVAVTPMLVQPSNQLF